MPATLQRRRLSWAQRPMLSDPSCVAAWRADRYDAATTALVDLTGRGHHAVFAAATNAPTRLVFSGRKYLYSPATSGNFLSVPDSAALSITGDILLMAYVVMDDWTPSALTTLVSKWTATGNQRSYALSINTDGTVSLFWTTLGAVTIEAKSTAATGITDGTGRWIIATLDVDNGAVGNTARIYTSSAAVTATAAQVLAAKTQLGSDVVGVGTTSIFDGTALINFPGQNAGTSNLVVGECHRAIVMNGYDGAGSVQLDIDCSVANEPFSTFTELSANAATVTANRSSTGKKIAFVDRTCVLFGADDYAEVADSALLDFDDPDSFTVVVALRKYGIGASTGGTPLAKKTGFSNTAGYTAFINTTGDFGGIIADGAASVNGGAVAGYTDGTRTLLVLRRDRAQDFWRRNVHGGAVLSQTDSLTATLATSEVLRIGRLSGAGTNYADMVFFGAAIFRRLLTEPETARLAVELGVG